MSVDVPRNTRLLIAAGQGRPQAEVDLMAMLHEELKGVAERLMRRERADHTLQPTALVHEAWIRLVDARELAAADRQRFFALTVRTMRRILIDHARGHNAQRRGGAWQRVQLDNDLLPGTGHADDLLQLDELLDRLSAVDARSAQAVELRLFGGLSTAEIAAVLDVSERTARNDLTAGQAWMARALAAGDEPG